MSSAPAAGTTVKGTFVVGDVGTMWVESELDEQEQKEAEQWIASHYDLSPGLSITITWLRADRIIGSICPKCRHLATTVSKHLDEYHGKLSLRTYFGCDHCHRTWRLQRTRERDVLYVVS